MRINCKILSKKNPQIFSSCGWTDCEKKSYEFWKSVPKEEYILWLGDVGSPMSVFSFFESSSKCFGELIQLKIDLKKPNLESISDPEGIEVKIYGSTEATKDKGKCGREVIRNLLPFPF